MLHLNILPLEDSAGNYCLGHEAKLSGIIKRYFAKCHNLPENLKRLTFESKSITEDTEEAYEYIEGRALDGDVEAQKTKGRINAVLDECEEPNYFYVQGNFKHNRLLAEQGDIYAIAMLGDKYYLGRGVKRNYEKAFSLYLQAANGSVKLAQYNVGGCYETGIGTEKDIDKAIFWYTKAANQGLCEAKRNLTRIALQKSNAYGDITSYMPTKTWADEPYITDEQGVKYSADGKRLISAPNDIEEYSIKPGTQVICNAAFIECEKLRSVNIPDGVQVIGNGSFRMCKSLTSVHLPSTVCEILGVAFDMSGLETITIPESTTTIEAKAFCYCKHLKSITIGPNVSHIEPDAFMWCENLKHIEVDKRNKQFDSRCDCNAIIETATNTLIAGCSTTTIPNTVAAIADNAFWGRMELESITIPCSIKSIGDRSFYRCDNLKEAIIHGGKIIGDEAFRDCSGLKTVTLPDTLEEIGPFAFYGCSNLETINFPCSLTTIRDNAFHGCKSLKNLSLPDSITRIEEVAFLGCTNATAVNIPKGIKNISDQTFQYCHATNITIPDGVKIISSFAFFASDLTEVTIPASVELIETDAFRYCENLKKVTILGTATKIQRGAFDKGVKL